MNEIEKIKVKILNEEEIIKLKEIKILHDELYNIQSSIKHQIYEIEHNDNEKKKKSKYYLI